MNWHLQDAKNNLSKLVQCARSEGPQTITLRGTQAAVVLSADEYDRLVAGAGPSLVDHLLKGTCLGSGIHRRGQYTRQTPSAMSPSDVSRRHQRRVRRAKRQRTGCILASFGSTRVVYLSVITLGEIMRGIQLKAKSDPRSAAHLTEWLSELRERHAANVLPITDRIAIEWGRICAIRPRGDADGLIAATALIHDLIVVTRNTADFEDAGVTVINPWIE